MSDVTTTSTNNATDGIDAGADGLGARYIAVWNEGDAAARRRLITELFTEDAVYIDPLADIRGHDALDGLIGAVRTQFAGLVFSLGGPVDGHHNVARFTWHLGTAAGTDEGSALVIGFDVVELAEDGRIRRVHGFLDKVPAGA